MFTASYSCASLDLILTWSYRGCGSTRDGNCNQNYGESNLSTWLKIIWLGNGLVWKKIKHCFNGYGLVMIFTKTKPKPEPKPNHCVGNRTKSNCIYIYIILYIRGAVGKSKPTCKPIPPQATNLQTLILSFLSRSRPRSHTLSHPHFLSLSDSSLLLV